MDLYGKVPGESWKPQMDALVELPESNLDVKLPTQLSVTFVRALLESWLDHPDLSALVITAINQFQDDILGMPESINAELALSMLILSAATNVEINYGGQMFRKRGEVQGLVPAALPAVREVVGG